MSINIGLPSLDGLKPKIAVIGVGGAGGNAIANMIAAEVAGVDFLVANTDAQALNTSKAERRLQLGAQITQGLGAGSRPEVGRAAAEESIVELEQALDGMHMVFIAAGMGGGTGTGAAPVIAKAARDKGILTVGVVTKPFSFEGARRMRSAEAGIEELQQHVDTLIVIPNQNLFMIAEAKTTFIEAFRMADEVLQQGVRGITDLMVMPGLVNLDFADVKSVMRDAGKAMMGTGEAEGEGRALLAAQQAIANPLLDGVSMQGAKGVIISISGGEDLGLFELQEAGDHIRDLVDPDANIIWGSAFNPALNGRIRVSVVATGLEPANAESQPVQRSGGFAFQQRPAAAAPSIAPTLGAAAPLAAQPIPAAEPEPLPVEEEVSLSPPPASPSLSFEAPPAEAPQPAAPAPGFAVYDDIAGEAHISPPVAAPEPDGLGDDELVLDSPSFGAPDAPATPPAAAAPPAADAPPPAGGSTLFERMKQLSRMESKGDDDDGDGDDGGFPSIPRFLGRQTNQ
ncbi:cell division protein FtsZ [Sphingomonas lacunae]|uniref:Cell division protein FtsZ n=1 Tax=Sphingomonas lacunae TaxID=2698828 RepID=A0A6M4AZ13_9SPHN|nr:cell division protein FtsZ [Sphingomonas lacunae]QJQ33299.1 cell division protein FtsZ [Sphingomonas lacunae]